MGLGILASAAVIFAIPYCTTVKSLFALQTATGISLALGLPAALAAAARCGDRFNGMGTVMSVFNSGMSIGLIVAPLVGGYVAARLGLDTVFKGGAMVVLAGLGLFVILIARARASGALSCLAEATDSETS